MYFDSEDQRKQIEDIAGRITFRGGEGKHKDFGKCRMKASPHFLKNLDEAWDLITILALALSALGQSAQEIMHCEYKVSDTLKIFYKIVSNDDIALFEIEGNIMRW